MNLACKEGVYQMPIVLFVLFAFMMLILFSGAYMFVVACVRRRELGWLDEDEILKTPYGKYYENICIGQRFLKEHNAQDVYVESFDGLKLHAMWVPAENPKGTILFAHGYRSSKLVDFSLAFNLYFNLGMNILVPDQRAHGESEGRIITFGVKESRDMGSWIDFHNENFGDFPIVLSGLSMGASTMLYLADKNLPDNVRGIIADCGFTSPKEILASVFRNVIHLPAAPTLLAAELFARIFGGFSFTQEDTRISLKNSKIPVLMVHGVDDDFVPCEMTKQGYAACTGPKELLLVDGAEHGVSFLVAREEYTKMVCEFLTKYLT